MISHDQESEVKSIRSRKPFPPFNPMSNGPMSNGSTNGSQTTSPGQFEFLPQARFPAHSLANNRPGSYSPSFTPSYPKVDNFPNFSNYSNSPFSPLPRQNGQHSKPTVTSQDNGVTYYHEPGPAQPVPNRMHHPAHFNDVIRNQAAMNGYPMMKQVDSENPRQKQQKTFFIDEDLRNSLLNRQMASQITYIDQINPFPDEIENLYHQLFPLEQTDLKSYTFNPIQISTFRINRRDGIQFCMKRIHDCRNISQVGLRNYDKWRSIRHANICRLHEVFSTKSFGDQSLVFVYDFHPCSDTLMDELFRVPNWKQKTERSKKPLPESVVWAYIVQLTSALRQIHALGLAYRAMDLTKIIKTGQNRIRLGSISIKDLLAGSQDDLQNLNRHQQEDFINLGHVLLSIATNTLSLPHNENIGKALDVVQKHYSKDLHQVIVYLIFGPNTLNGTNGQLRNRSINDLMPLIGARFYTVIDDVFTRGDRIEDELSTTLENGRLFRLMCKLGAVETNNSSNNYETGDLYLLKLYHDHLFRHDMSHIVQSLNKLDIGSPERFILSSHDNQNVLVVSYSDIQKATSKCFQDLLRHHE